MEKVKTTNNIVETNLEDEIERLQEMIRSPQMHKLRASVRKNGIKALRPRNAATIILIDGEPGDFKILMGQRNKAMKFMPGALVFPGGAVDPGDGSIPALDEFEPQTAQRIFQNLRGNPTKRASRALAMAAARELAEETGLLLGGPSETPPTHPDWQFYKDQQMAPLIGSLRLLARATTPPGAPRRFDTWFFVAPAKDLGFIPKGGFAPSGELENLRWVTPHEAICDNTREITRVVLMELINRLSVDPMLSPATPAPNYYFRSNEFQRVIMP